MFSVLAMLLTFWAGMCARELALVAVMGELPRRPRLAAILAGIWCVVFVCLFRSGVGLIAKGYAVWPEPGLLCFMWLAESVVLFGVRVEITGNILIDTAVAAGVFVLVGCILAFGAYSLWYRGVTAHEVLYAAIAALALSLIFRVLLWALE